MVSPRKSRRKSACFSSTTTSTPARASKNPSIMPAGPPPAIAQRTVKVSAVMGLVPRQVRRSLPPQAPEDSPAAPATAETLELSRLTAGGQPVQHDPVEGLRPFHIGEVAGVGNLLVARAGHQAGEALVLGGRRAGIGGAADYQGRQLHAR